MNGKRLRGMRILVVEDWFPVADEIIDMLESMECEVVGPVPDVERGLDATEHEHPDAALLDVMLGDETVFPLARRLDAAHIPYIFVTACGAEQLPPEFRGKPRVPKPVIFDRLQKMMVEKFTSEDGGHA